MNYEGISGTKATVVTVGKSFELVIEFPASKRVPAERKVIKCKAWSGVEKQLKKWRLSDA